MIPKPAFLISTAIVIAMPAAAWCQRPNVIVAGRYLAPDGTLGEGRAIVLSSGKIKSLRDAGEVDSARAALRFPDAVITPGLIDLAAAPGAFGKVRESVDSIDPAASAHDAIDWHHPQFAQCVEAGITTVMVAPSAGNLVNGAAAVIKTAGADPRARTLSADGPLVFAIGSGVLRADRAPTSRLGAVSMLREALVNAADGKGHPRMREFIGNTRSGLVICETPMDLDAAIRTFKNHTARLVLSYAGELAGLDHLGDPKPGFVAGPFGFDARPRQLAAPAKYLELTSQVALAGGMPQRSADALRITAALAVRYGMDAAAARRAITAVPAAIAGVDRNVGAISPGRDADLVVFSDDPLKLDARVLAVFIDGVEVYRRQEHAP